MPASFVHLRVHSAYSLAESTLRIKKIAALAVGDAQPAVAVTDTNNMFGALEFCKTMIGEGVQPIVGVQALLSDARGTGEVALLAQDGAGYANLCKLNSKALLDVEGGDDPVISMDDLAAHADGVLLLGGGAMAGALPCCCCCWNKQRLRRCARALRGSM